MITAGVGWSTPVGTGAGQLTAQLLHAWTASYCCEVLPVSLCEPANTQQDELVRTHAHCWCLQHWPPALANADCNHCTCSCNCQASLSTCSQPTSSSKCGTPHADKG